MNLLTEDFYTYAATFLACYVACVVLFDREVFLKAVLAFILVALVSLMLAI